MANGIVHATMRNEMLQLSQPAAQSSPDWDTRSAGLIGGAHARLPAHTSWRESRVIQLS